MKIVLPDNSFVFFNPYEFKFTDFSTINSIKRSKPIEGFNFRLFRDYLENPKYTFSKCFRRVNNTPMYTRIQSTYRFKINFLSSLYELERIKGYGGMFSPSEIHYKILDGKIIQHSGYGWGSHHWEVVEGYETLRLLCLFLGIKQPVRIKGEERKSNLSEILLKLSKYELDPSIDLFFKSWYNPWTYK